jgi:hypothetical protein
MNNDDDKPVRLIRAVVSSQGCETSKYTTLDACLRGLSGGVMGAIQIYICIIYIYRERGV